MIEVGQTLWFVPTSRRSIALDVKVAKVGRKWAYLTNRDRVCMRTLDVDGGNCSSPGRCYLSREHYEEARVNDAAWRGLEDAMRYTRRPENVTAEQINQARRLLGL